MLQKIWSIFVLEHAWATKATATWAATHWASEATTSAATSTTARTTRAHTEALTSSLTSKEVQTIDDVKHTLAGKSVVLCIGTHRSCDGTRKVRLLVQDIIKLQ